MQGRPRSGISALVVRCRLLEILVEVLPVVVSVDATIRTVLGYEVLWVGGALAMAQKQTLCRGEARVEKNQDGRLSKRFIVDKGLAYADAILVVGAALTSVGHEYIRDCWRSVLVERVGQEVLDRIVA